MTTKPLVDRWKVILDPSITDTAFTSHLEAVCYAQQTGRLDQLLDPSPPEAEASPAQAESHPSISEVFSPNVDIVRYVFHIGDLRAYSGSFSPEVVAAILPLSIVRDVQPVHRIFPRAMNVENNPNCWGLGAISHRSGSSNDYVYEADTTHAVVVYVIDTGIRITHTEFDGRASHGATFPPGDPAFDTDRYGHGTHVAGTVGGRTCGVAKTAQIIAVKVWDPDTDNGDDDMAAGVQWAINHATGATGHGLRTVVNISMGGDTDYFLNDVVNTAFARGMTVAVAAGNDGIAGSSSPDSAHGALSVGYTKQGPAGGAVRTTVRDDISRYGPGVHLFAPGADIYSCGIESDVSYVTKSGTSMASPHVAGVAAYLLSHEQGLDNAPKVTARILALATRELIQNVGAHSPNLFLYNGSGL